MSLSTVDRVLNGRESVRPATRDRVRSAMENLGYCRNTAAANLSKRRHYRFRFLLPAGANSFMRLLEDELRAYAVTLMRDRISVEIETLPPFDADALVARLEAVTPAEIDGLALVAIDAPAVRQALSTLRGTGLPVVTIVSDLPGELRNHFVGINNIWAGRTAAGLLGRFCCRHGGKIAVIAGSMRVQDHAERRVGFEQVMATDFPDLNLLPPIEALDDSALAETRLQALLAQEGEIAGLYSLGAGNRGVLAALEPLNTRPRVIVHELTDHSRRWLQSGRIDAVIRQDPARESRAAIRTLAALSDGRAFHPDENRVGVEIFLRDNLP